jgi:hypothetical protein
MTQYLWYSTSHLFLLISATVVPVPSSKFNNPPSLIELAQQSLLLDKKQY